MQLDSIEGNTQKLDGGSMFGNCPRALWERWAPADELHRIDLACRCLLIRDEHEGRSRAVLLETGIGAFFEPKLRERFGVQEEEHVLLRSLAALGLRPEQIDVIVLSHMHFDHAGGLLLPWSQTQGALELAFPNATYVVGEDAWARALSPHPRDRASFIPGLCALLESTGRVEIVSGERSDTLGPNYSFSYSEGHTPGLTLTRVQSPRGPITFMGDLIPGAPWVHLPITMGYDRYPERLIEEKRAMLEGVIAEDGWAFYTHDPKIAASKVAVDERGKFRAVETLEHLHWT
ncbi:MBL fold metallo-hydrolase [Pseudenhygromyxa sp. WMMC2535]|uniref:MBL fold metallo-hydrolase n=1 Tax=Pseudenhygromyxa sp. WMMC2535 TaxID=2712867 RepID=UPI0015539CD6|nr:MBL fold metallo-hydrolase [Pseudenhygromyxa sp. WMMC2535]NVB37021.1 MBL fold metallo-hydrolase [Pseudenhygromyxa sp. WMMC2535]